MGTRFSVQKHSKRHGRLLFLLALWCASPGFAQETQKPRTILQGRIEQIAGSNQLADVVLRKLSPKLDSRAGTGSAKPQAALKSGAEVSSYPAYLLGRWGGDLKIIWSVTAPGYETALPQYRLGNIGSLVLHFGNVGRDVRMLPTVIFFPIEEVPVTQSVINTTKIEAESVEAFKKQTLETGILRGVPTLPLAKFNGEGLSGKKFVSRVIHDSTRVLKPGVVEQDVVIGEWKDGAIYNYREFVSRFTWYGKDRIYAQILVANFGVSRQAISKTLMEGWMGSNWRPTANSIANRLDTTWEDVVRRDGIQ